MAAVLACGEGTVLSHFSAAELWGVRRRARRLWDAGVPGIPPVDVTVPTDSGRARRTGIRLRRSRTLSSAECTQRDGIPVTKPSRTLADIRPLVSPAQFNAAVREAEYLGLPLSEVRTDHTRSELEAKFLRLLRRHRLPQPVVNVQLDRFIVDFLWPDARLVVELDGWRGHGTRSAFEQDRARDAGLTLLRYEVLRFTWRQIEDDVPTVIATIRQLLRTPAVSRS
jgi:very-short-patch-repair endonuclease